MECSQDGGIFTGEPDFVKQLQHDFQRFYGQMFKHFVADVVRSSCSVLRVIDSREKFVKGKGLIQMCVDRHRMGQRMMQQSCFDWQGYVNKT